MRALFAALLLLGALPGGVAAQDITTAQATLRTIPLRLVTATGRHDLRVELAATPREQQIGMMFRTRLPRGKGMLFPFATPMRLSFWMENTVIPLDLVFIGADARVLNIAAKAKPYSRDLIPSQGMAVAVLELAGGEAAHFGLKAGDRVEYRLP